MNKLLILRTFLIVTQLLIFASCGFVEDDPVAGTAVLEVSDLESDCEVDTERIKNIFSEDVKADIVCIEQQLDLFRYVRRQNQDLLTKPDIEKFIRQFFEEDQQDDIISGLDLLFQLNTLILRDKPDQMQVKNIEPFFELLRVVNKRAVTIFDNIEVMQKLKADEVELFRKRRKVLEEEFIALSKEILGLVKNANGPSQSINIQKFIEELSKDVDGFEDFQKLISSLLFVKKLFLGGDRNFINSNELLRAFELFPIFAFRGFDVYLQKEEFFNTQGEYYESIADNIEVLVRNVYEHQNEEFILTVTDIHNFIDELYKESDDDSDGSDEGIFSIFRNSEGDSPSKKEERDILKNIVRSFKRDIIGGDTEVFNYSEVEKTVALIIIGARTFENVTKLSDLVEDINDKTPEERVIIRGSFVKTFSELSKKARELIVGNTDFPKRMRLLKFIQSIAEDTDYIDLDKELLNSLFSMKVAVVGGTREILTNEELKNGLIDGEAISKLFYDLNYRAQDYSDKSDQQIFNFFVAQARGLKALLYSETDDAGKPINLPNIISLEDIRSIAEIFFDEDEQGKIDALVNLVDNFIKNFLVINDRSTIDLNELKVTTDTAIIGLKALEFVGYHQEVKDRVSKTCGELKSQDACMDFIKTTKEEYNKKLSEVKESITIALSNQNFLNKEVELNAFLEDLSRSSDLFDLNTQILIKGAKLKPGLTGGNQTTLNKDEVTYLSTKFMELGSIAYDGLITDFDSIENDLDLYKIFLNLVKNFKSLTYKFDDENTSYFSISQILEFAKDLIDEAYENDDDPNKEKPIDPTKFKWTIIDFVERILVKNKRAYFDSTRDLKPEFINPDVCRTTIDGKLIPDDAIVDYTCQANTFNPQQTRDKNKSSCVIKSYNNTPVSPNADVRYSCQSLQFPPACWIVKINNQEIDPLTPITDGKDYGNALLKYECSEYKFNEDGSLEDEKVPFTFNKQMVDEADLEFTQKAMMNTFDVVQRALETMIFADVTYDDFKDDVLEKTQGPVTGDMIKYGRLPEYELIEDDDHFKYLKSSFIKVAENFKYFRDETSYPVYLATDKTIRKKPGFTGVVLWRYLLEQVVIAYGPLKDRKEPEITKGFTTEAVNNFLLGVKSILLELELWTSNFKTFGGNVLLLADLFQNRSDGTLTVSIDEATEFVELLFASGSLSTQMYDYMVDVACKDQLEPRVINGVEKTAVKSDCVRRQFFETLFNRQNHPRFSDLPDMSKYLPRLKQYYDNDRSPNKQNSYDYVRGVETFSRDVESLDILDKTPWLTSDFTLVLGAMLNIESTFIRFDLDDSNILDFDELENALFSVYNGGIINIANLCGWTTRFSKTVFMYLIKFGKSPPTQDGGLTVAALDLVYKWYFDETTADRLAIGKLLKSLKEENDKKTTAGDDEEVKQCEEQSEELLNVGMDDVNQVINGLENNNAFNNGLDIPSFPGF